MITWDEFMRVPGLIHKVINGREGPLIMQPGWDPDGVAAVAGDVAALTAKPTEVLQGTLKLSGMKLAHFDAEARAAFRTTLEDKICACGGAQGTTVKVLAARAGSVVVDYEVLPPIGETLEACTSAVSRTLGGKRALEQFSAKLGGRLKMKLAVTAVTAPTPAVGPPRTSASLAIQMRGGANKGLAGRRAAALGSIVSATDAAFAAHAAGGAAGPRGNSVAHGARNQDQALAERWVRGPDKWAFSRPDAQAAGARRSPARR